MTSAMAWKSRGSNSNVFRTSRSASPLRPSRRRIAARRFRAFEFNALAESEFCKKLRACFNVTILTSNGCQSVVAGRFPGLVPILIYETLRKPLRFVLESSARARDCRTVRRHRDLDYAVLASLWHDGKCASASGKLAPSKARHPQSIIATRVQWITT